MATRPKIPKRKRAWRYRQRRPAVGGPNEAWAMDFMSDQLFDRRPFRILTVIDRHSREALTIVPRVSFRGLQVVEALDRLAAERGKPKSLRVDNVLCREGIGAYGPQVSIRQFGLAAGQRSTRQAAPARGEGALRHNEHRVCRHRGASQPSAS